MKRFLSAVILCGLVPAGAVLGQDGPFEIKRRKPTQGEVVRQSETLSQKTMVSVTGMDEKETETIERRFVFVETIVEKAASAKKATKLKRVYEVADLEKNGEKVDLGLVGKTLLIEMKNGKYTFRFEGGGSLTDAARTILDQKFEGDRSQLGDLCLPKKAVRVGESWPSDVSEVTKAFEGSGLIIDAGKSKVTGTLKKVYSRNGKQFGVVTIAMDLVIPKLGKMGQVVPLNEGSKFRLDAELDMCIDGSDSTSSGVQTSRGSLTAEVMGASRSVILEAKETAKTEIVKK